MTQYNRDRSDKKLVCLHQDSQPENNVDDQKSFYSKY